jgi:hypothetical protein
MPPKPSDAFVPGPPAQTGTATQAVVGASFRPNLGTARPESPPTKIESRPPFLLRAHPERWGVIGGKVLPVLGRVPLIPGVGGVQIRRDGSMSIADAEVNAKERGWCVIPLECLPPSHKKAGRDTYLWQPPGRADVTLTIYERVYAGSTATSTDLAGYIEFLEYLIAQGIVPKPPHYILVSMREKANERLAKARDLARAVPSAALAVDHISAEIAAIDAALAAAAPVEVSA